MAACLFAVSPLGVHSVTWISGRKDTLCTAISLACLILLWPSQSQQTGTARIQKTIFGLLLFVLALGAKELALAVPIVFAALVWFGVHPNSTLTLANKKRLCFRWSLMIVLAVTFVVARKILLGGIGLGADYPSENLTLNIGTFSKIGWYQVGRVIFPWRPCISDSWEISTQFGALEWIAILSWVAILALVLWAFWERFVWGLPLFWFLAWMVPVSGVLPLQHITAERYLYPASWGILLFSVAILFRFSINPMLRRSTIVALTAVAVAWGSHTFFECKCWHNDELLFSTMIERDEHYGEGHLALAHLAIEAKEFETAKFEANRAQQIAGSDEIASFTSPYVTYTYLGLANYQLGQFNESAKAFQMALKFRPNNAVALYHRGWVALAQRDFETAERHFRASFKINPDDRLCRGNLGSLLLQTNRFEECNRMLEPLVQLDDVSAVDLSNFATAALIQKRYQLARTSFLKLNLVVANDAITLSKLAWAEYYCDEFESAQGHLEEAEKINQDHPTVQHVRQLLDKPR